jgi:RHS repeat-associated protein
VATVVLPNNAKATSTSLATMSKATLKKEASSTQVTSFTYNDKGQRTSSTQPNGGSSSSIYDANGNQVKSISPLGFTTETLAFDKAGRALETKSFDGKILETTYDSMGRVLTTTRDGKTTTNQYDGSGRNIKTTYADGRVQEKKYDTSGNVVESWNNQGDRSKSYFDLNNNLVKTESYKDNKLTNQNQTEYDSKNRVVANIDSKGNRTTYTYNSQGQQTTVTDALGRVTKSVYNAKGQLAQTINPDGKATTYTYNADGQRTEVETPNGATFKFAYDSLQRVTKKENPDRGVTTYTYDVSGNIVTESNAKDETKTYTYDIANRKVSTSYDDATLNESYEYDNGANAKGKLTKITDASGSMEFAYDVDGNLASKIQTISNQRFTTSYTYDEHDRMTSQTYPSGKVIGYVYDDKGELLSQSIDGIPFIKDIKTNDNGLLSYEYADGSKHTREYDSNGRVTKLNYPNYTEEVNYNVVSNITNIKSDIISRAFGYDNLDRLTSYEQNATDFQNFVYDANGNRLNQDQDNNETKVFTYAQNSNILNSIKESNSTDTNNIFYEYDATGNIIKDDKHTYAYDSRNRLTAIDSNVTYQYNYDNKRVSKTVNGVKTYFVYDGHMLVGEYQLNLRDDSRQEFVYLNSTPIATLKPKENYRVYTDHLDTSRRVATDDDKAEVLWEWESKPFGESKANNDVDGDGKAFTHKLRFPGQYFDVETSTHYNINRDYNPVTGRYIQSDPIGFDGGVNGFGYVGGNPLIYIDEEGKFAQAIYLNPVAYTNPIGWATLVTVTAYVAYIVIFEEDTWWGGTVYYFDPTQGTRVKNPKTGETGWLQDDGSLWVKDRAGGNSHGGSAWKRWNKKRDWDRGKKREGTYDKDGKRLRD